MIKKKSMPSGIFTALLLILMISGSGCSTLNGQSVRQNADVELIKELMAPLYIGQQKLIETIGTTDHDLIVFRMENNRVKRLPEKGPGTQLWEQRNIVFFRINESGKNNPGIYYFDQQTFRLYRLDQVENPSQTVTLSKTIPCDGKWMPVEQSL